MCSASLIPFIHYLPPLTRSKKSFIPRKRRLLFSGVSRTLDLAFDVVSLAKESEPVVEHFLVLVRQIRPVGPALFGFEGGLPQSAGGVFAGEDCESSVWLVVSSAAAVLMRDIYQVDSKDKTYPYTSPPGHKPCCRRRRRRCL